METRADRYLNIIMNRGKATYRNGQLDFSRGEGGNNHIYLRNPKGGHMGYMWFDIHCEGFGFCTKDLASVNGVFAAYIRELYPEKWNSPDGIIRFTGEMFVNIMDHVIDYIR